MAKPNEIKEQSRSDMHLLASKSQPVFAEQRGFGVSKKTGDRSVCDMVMIYLSYFAVVITFPFSLYCIFRVVEPYQRMIILRNGTLYKKHALGPGFVHDLMCVDTIWMVDLRIISYGIPKQEVLTSEFLSISVEAAVFYKVVNPIKAALNVTSFKSATQLLAATFLRNAIGAKTLREILSNRAEIMDQVTKALGASTREWGIHIVKVEMKDISLTPDLQRAMAAEAETIRIANAKIMVTKAEIKANKSLDRACTLLMDNPFGLQLRYLQSLHTIASDKTHTILIPFSIPAYKKIFKK